MACLISTSVISSRYTSREDVCSCSPGFATIIGYGLFLVFIENFLHDVFAFFFSWCCHTIYILSRCIFRRWMVALLSYHWHLWQVCFGFVYLTFFYLTSLFFCFFLADVVIPFISLTGLFFVGGWLHCCHTIDIFGKCVVDRWLIALLLRDMKQDFFCFLF